jgi:hypothetical protein
MKLLSRVLLLAVGLAVLSAHAPTVSRAGEMPVEKKAPNGVTTLTYGGQTFRVTASAQVIIRFEEISPTLIRISLIADEETIGNSKISMYWVDFQTYIYVGLIPLDIPWEGTLNTEGGFVDR